MHLERSEPISTGIIGLGRSGWLLHALILREMSEKYRVVAVADPDPVRREEAVRTLGCQSYRDVKGLVADRQVELVVVASPTHVHVNHSILALAAGKHVVCEKPVATKVSEVKKLIGAAATADRTFTVYQRLRYAADFLKVRAVIESGCLGRLVSVAIRHHIFQRRWDWQTLTKYGGGELYNRGAHLVDQALHLLGDNFPEVFAHVDRALTVGDAEDHFKIILRGPGAPLIEIDCSRACAYPQDYWLIMGISGGLRGSADRLEWKYVDWSKMGRHPLDDSLEASGRVYCRENLEWHEESWHRPADTPLESVPFYENLYQTLRHDAPLAVTPESVLPVVAVLERCFAQVGFQGERMNHPGSASAL